MQIDEDDRQQHKKNELKTETPRNRKRKWFKRSLLAGFFSHTYNIILIFMCDDCIWCLYLWPSLLLVFFKASRLLPFAYDNVCVYKIPLFYGIIWLLVLLLLCFHFDCFRICTEKGMNNIFICQTNGILWRSFNRIPR